MKVKNTAEYRKFIQEREQLTNYDPNFVGANHENKMGFFKIMHGIKDNIKNFLRGELQNAEDDQAIYEFIQNAADCDSTEIFIFYDEKYFLAINNGKPFENNDIESILNIKQSSKEGQNKIGRYGIGFKLVHRLVGKEDGLKELVEEYKGPIIFSWKTENQFKELFDYKESNTIEKDSKQNDVAWLFKIILTCFPTGVNEKVKDLQFQERILFPESELIELVNFLHQKSESLSEMNKKQGSIFFLKFGENKSSKLNASVENLKSGIQYSLNTLKKLKKVGINDEVLHEINIKKEILPPVSVGSDTFKKINPEFDTHPIEIIVGYPEKIEKALALRSAPNIYQYFPMGDEIHGLSFIIHSTSFVKETNRRKLSESSDINKATFEYLSKKLIEQLEKYKENDLLRYQRFFLSILLSKPIIKENNKLVVENLYKPLLTFIKKNVVTQNKKTIPYENVWIKNTKLPINPNDFGIKDKEWFYWSSLTDSKDEKELEEKEILKQVNAKDEESPVPLDLANITDMVAALDTVDKINNWLVKNDTHLQIFISELNQFFSYNYSNEKFVFNFQKIKIFKFNDHTLFSMEELINKYDYLILNSKTTKIANELEKIGFKICNIDLSKYGSFLYYISVFQLDYLNNDEILFEIIQEKLEKNELSPSEKEKIFLNFLNAETKFMGIGDEKIRKLKLFSNNKNEIIELGSLVHPDAGQDSWLSPYKIKTEEFITSISKYLIKKEDIYSSIIRMYWEEITKGLINEKDVTNFYSSVVEYFKLKPGNQILNDKDYIYVNKENGFLDNDSVFYNKELKTVRKYELLTYIVSKIRSLVLPHQSILTFMEQQPFSTKGDSIEVIFDEMQDTELTKEELDLLIQFIEQNRGSVFKYIVITKSSDKYFIKKKTNEKIQFDSSLKEIEDYIVKLGASEFYRIPEEINSSITIKDGIFNENETTSILLDTFFQNDLIDLVVNREIATENRIKYLEIVSNEEVQIDLHKEYKEDSLLVRILELAYFTFKDGDKKNELESFRKKIKVKSGEKVYTIEDISINNDVTFSFIGENQHYILSLDKILPISYSNASILDSIVQNLNFLGKFKIDFLCNVNKELRKDLIYSELEKSYTLLENSHQLAFLCLYAKSIKNADSLTKFQLEENINIESQDSYYYLTEKKYLNKNHIIPYHLSGLGKLLKIEGEQKVFQIENTFHVLFEPIFIDDTFICAPVKYELCDDLNSQKELFLDVYSAWNTDKTNSIKFIKTLYHKDKQQERIYDSGFSSLSNSYIFTNWKASDFIYPSEYGIQEEFLADWILEWVNSQKDEIAVKEQFLKSLGVNTSDSKIVQVRKFLQIGEGEISKENIISLNNLFSKVYNNTTLWLEEKKVSIDCDNLERLNWLKEIYKKVDYNTEFTFPIIVKKNENKFYIEFAPFIRNKEYIAWSGKTDDPISIEDNISLHLDEILSHENNFTILDGNIIEQISLESLEIEFVRNLLTLKLDKDFVISNYKEFNRQYYLEWKKLLGFPVTVYEIDKEIPYNIFLKNIRIKTIFWKNIAIEDNIIVFHKKFDFYSEDLRSFIGTHFFDQRAYDLLGDSKKKFPDEIIQIKRELQNKLTDPITNFSEIQRLTLKLLNLDDLNSRFSIDSGIITKLGEELVAKSQTAIAEIVKNAFDADASLCKVIFKNIDQPNASIIIEDDGLGMTREQLINGFMRISTKEKVENPYSPIYKRKRAGEKGIGRFATQKLGHKLTITTQTETSNTAWQLSIDWKLYEESKELTSIENPLDTIEKQVKKGTKIIIEELKDPWDEESIKKLYHYIYSIQSPYRVQGLVEGDPGFNTDFFIRENDEERIIANEESEIHSYALAEIEGKVDEKGFGSVHVISKELNINEFITIYLQQELPFNIVKDIYFKVYYFLYIKDYIPRGILNSIKEFGRQNGGIRLYRNGFRVLPYGEKGDDWLGLDESSNRRTLKLPHANMNFIGYVSIKDLDNSIFKETSSREGLIHTEGYNELRILLYKSMIRVASKILQIRGLDSFDVIPEKVQDIRLSVEQSKLNEHDRNLLLAKIKDLEETIQHLSETTDEKRLLRILAGIGLVMGEFTHELKGSVSALRSNSQLIHENIENPNKIQDFIKRNDLTIKGLQTYFDYIDDAFSNNKRKELKEINLLGEIHKFVEILKNESEKLGIEILIDHIETKWYKTCPMHPSDWSSIFLNLYSNSRKALKRSGVMPGKIKINLYLDENFVNFEFQDNGDGIKDSIKDRIFEPFVSIAGEDFEDEERSSGLGLYIIREILNSYSGRISLSTPEKDFITCFKIQVPKGGKK